VPSQLIILSGHGQASGSNGFTQASISIGPNESKSYSDPNLTLEVADLAPGGISAGKVYANVQGNIEFSASADVEATFQIVPSARSEQLGVPVIIELNRGGQAGLGSFSYSVSGAPDGSRFHAAHIGDQFTVHVQATAAGASGDQAQVYVLIWVLP